MIATRLHRTAHGPMRPTAGGGLAVVLISGMLSLGAMTMLDGSMRIRWHVGAYRHYGPTHVDAAAVLLAFPLSVLAVYLASRWLAGLSGEGHRSLFELGVLCSLGMIVWIQGVLLGLNLVFP